MSKKKIYSKHLEKGRFYTHSDRQGGHPALLYKKRDQKICILLFCLPLLQEKSDLNLNTASTNLERRTIMSTIIRRFLEEEILVANH